MSLGIAIKGPEGVVLAADSRVILTAQRQGLPHPMVVNFDNATKLLSFSDKHNYVGAVTYGEALLNRRTAHGYIPEFEQVVLSEQKERLAVSDYAQRLSTFFMERWNESMPQDYPGSGMVFIVGGYSPIEAYGEVFLFNIPRQPDPQPQNVGPGNFGMTWGGQLEIASRLIHGYDPMMIDILRNTLSLDEQQINTAVTALQQRLEFGIPFQVLPLQDCVDLAIFMIRTTITAQELSIGIRGVGGNIDVAVISRTAGLEYIQRKTIRGEQGRLG